MRPMDAEAESNSSAVTPTNDLPENNQELLGAGVSILRVESDKPAGRCKHRPIRVQSNETKSLPL
jgi:hypothetical protein